MVYILMPTRMCDTHLLVSEEARWEFLAPRKFTLDLGVWAHMGNRALSGWNEASQVVLVVKNLPAKAGEERDTGLIPGWGRCPGGRHGSPL